MSNKPVLYGSSTCLPCLEVCDFIRANKLDVEVSWVLPRMDTTTYDKYHHVIASGVRVDGLGGVPTLVDGEVTKQGSTEIIQYLTFKYISL